MPSGKSLIIIGIVLIVIAIALFVAGTINASSIFKSIAPQITSLPRPSITVQPNKALQLMNISPTHINIVIYNSTHGKLLVLYTSNSVNQTAIQETSHGLYIAIVMPSTAAYILNNSTQPVLVSYAVIPFTSSLLTTAVMEILAIIVGIIGVILLIVGLVFYFIRRR
ncbi:MAG: hypothetical protein OWQ54_06725 [Sulfolobaceae archaeon]|nr:hypothetical protein [Sulfolobaceae archaeon]